jgi:RHS repeat-associated protein
MQHGPKEELRVAALCAGALPLAAALSPEKNASDGEHSVSEKLASWVFGQKTLHCFRAVEQLSGKLRWGCENSSAETAAGSAVTLDGASYTLDNAGNRTAKTDQRTVVATSYGYDNIYQLLSATQGATTTENYTYDPVGNRLSDLTTSGWSNNTSNELTARPGVSYTFDANGNTTSKTDSTGTTNYSWDFENRLTSVTLPGSGGTVSFKYDPFGRRIYKSSSTATSVYAYDGDNLVEETNSSGTVVARYAQTQNVDEPLAMLRSSATSYYEADGLGSVTSLSSAAGALAQTYTFDSFGKQTGSTGSLTNPFQFIAREFDSETSLYFMRARYFDPQTGRFINEDPAGFDAGSPNFYAYVGNDPTDGIDPYGLKCIRKLILVTAYSDPGPGKDWPYFAPKKRGGKPGGAGPGIVAVANTNPPPYPFGSGVTVSNNPDPFGSDNPLAGPAYSGYVHDTGAGWDPNHHNVSPDDWIDIWLPGFLTSRRLNGANNGGGLPSARLILPATADQIY